MKNKRLSFTKVEVIILLFSFSSSFAFGYGYQSPQSDEKIISIPTKDSTIIPKPVKEVPHLKMGPYTRLLNGNLLAIDHNESLISNDEGKTWKAFHLFSDTQKYEVRPERALLTTRSGVVILAFLNNKEKSRWNWNNKTHDAPEAILPTYTIRSLDGGRTWQDLQKLQDNWSGAVRDIIETDNGTIIFTTMTIVHHPGHHAVLTYRSEDDGKSWTHSNIIDLGGIGSHGGILEATLVQLKDKRIWMLMRTNWGRFWEVYSKDEGISWQDANSTSIPASSAPGMIKRLQSGNLVLVWNRPFPEGKKDYPLTGGDGNWSEVPVSNYRQELSIMFSPDEGHSWSRPKVIAKINRNGSQLSYPYIFEVRPGVLWITTMFGNLAICLKEQDFVGLETEFNEKWFKEEQVGVTE
jgi:hypothetical protein